MKKLILLFVVWLAWVGICFAEGDYLGDLGVVIVTPTKKDERLSDLPTNVDVITRDEILRSNAGTVAEVIENIVGITDVSRYGTRGAVRNIRIRSGTAEQVLIMIDGQPINDIGIGSANLELIPVEYIERIEII